MMDMTVTKDVAAPADKVWGVLTDLDGAQDILTAVNSVERLDEGSGFDVGTKWRETRTMMGRTSSAVLEVTEVDPGHSYTWESDGQGAHYVGSLSVEPSGEGSLLTMTFGGEANGTFTRILAATIGKLFEGTTRKTLQQDLNDVAAAAEAG